MKPFLLALLMLLGLSPCIASCSTGDPELPLQAEQVIVPNHDDEDNNNDNPPPMSNKLTIRIGTSTFMGALDNTVAAKAFKALLPLTLNMAEHNGNEKFDYISTNLPTLASRPGTIRAGELMLFGSNCVVLFYETFSSSYSYTRLGRIDSTSGLATALGSGNVTVTFE